MVGVGNKSSDQEKVLVAFSAPEGNIVIPQVKRNSGTEEYESA